MVLFNLITATATTPDLSLVLYGITGLLRLPVVLVQLRLRDYARSAAQQSAPLPPDYFRLFRFWFACGVPAFLAVMANLWLMIARQAISVI